MADKIILDVSHLKTYFHADNGTVKAVDDISFYLEKGEILALVGESGCGKSVTVNTIMGLTRSRSTEIQGDIILDGKINVTTLAQEEYRSLRGKKMSMIFQEPMASFDPLYTVGAQLLEVINTHMNLTPQKAKEAAIESLRDVRIPEPEKRMEEYPHQMSGGMLQRILIAMALVTEPELLIADEPTTALDVTIQGQVLTILKELQKCKNTAVIFITHDLGVVAELADRVHVMYAGRIVEKGSIYDIFEQPKHPYTQGLLDSRVKPEYHGGVLPHISGSVPRIDQLPEGCAFHPRCAYADDMCRQGKPQEILIDKGHSVCCWKAQRIQKGDAQ